MPELPEEGMRLCLGCMNYIDAKETVCSNCQTSKYEENESDVLRRGSLLDSRFLIGKVLKRNGEHIVYIGKDNDENKRYFIKEYAPKVISSRNEAGEVLPKLPYEAQHKTYMVDFLDMHQMLKQLNSLPGLLPIEEIVISNKTVYIVYRFEELTPLVKYIESCGKIDWSSCKEWVFKLNSLLINLNNNGIVHRGISTQSIFFGADQNVILWDFLTPCFRTKSSQLIYELFDGFSAPEQYSSNKWQGEWTDVYAMACVLTNVLTGHRPEELPENFWQEKGPDCSLPPNVLAALGKALKSNCQERTQTVKQFNAELLEECEPTGDPDRTVIFRIEEGAEKPSVEPEDEVEVGEDQMQEKTSGRWKLWVCAAAGVLVVAVLGAVAYFVWFKNEEKPQKLELVEQESARDAAKKAQVLKEKVPNFVGEKFTDVVAKVGKTFMVEQTEVFDDVVPEGVVVSQLPSPGEQYVSGETQLLRLAVSKGAETAAMPDVVGQSIEEAEETLKTLKINYDKIFVETNDDPADVVIKVSNEGGQEILTGQEIKINKEKVLLYLKKV